MKATNASAAASLNAQKAALDGGFLYYFAGTEPASAGEALDMVNTHTQVLKLSVNGDDVTGLTFDTATSLVLAKAAAEAWTGLVAFDGFQSAETTLAPLFFRFGAPGDNCRGATSGVRIQGTIGGPASSADVKLTDGTTVTRNGTNTRSLPIFNINQLYIGG